MAPVRKAPSHSSIGCARIAPQIDARLRSIGCGCIHTVWNSEYGTRSWSLSDGLFFLLDRLRGSEEHFQRYAAQYEVLWWCGHFQSAFDGGPTLSPELLKRLAALGAELLNAAT
jgi:hypothetical protein